nr:MAG TPA: hypothetical protein [Caudoviricetes sp.]
MRIYDLHLFSIEIFIITLVYTPTHRVFYEIH